MVRTPAALVPFIFLLAFVAAGLLWHAGERTLTHPAVRTSGTAAVGGPFALTDANGAIVRDSDFRGRYMLVFFGFTSCPDVCPTTLAVIAGALDRLGGTAGRIAPIFISVDPARDTPEIVGEYVAAFDSRIVGLTGSAEAVAEAAAAYRAPYRQVALEGGGYTVDHASIVYLMGPDGAYLTHFSAEMGPERLAQELARRVE